MSCVWRDMKEKRVSDSMTCRADPAQTLTDGNAFLGYRIYLSAFQDRARFTLSTS